jgi:hypothetical protein
MTTARKAIRSWAPAAATGLLCLAVLGCPDWVNVTTPDIINPGAVANSDGAIASYNGAIGAFSFANDGDNGGTEGQILVSGTTADEYFDSETFPTRIEYDSRAITEQNTTLQLVFFNLAQARVALEHSAAALLAYAPAPASRVGEMYSLAGFSYVYFAENYAPCVPIDERQADGSLSYGTPLTTNQLLDSAIARFNSALAQDTGASAGAVNGRGLASIGLGRALLDQGKPALAAAAVAAVPTSFRYNTVHSSATNREWNGVFVFNNQAPLGTARFSVSDLEGGVGLNFRTALDARVSAPRNLFGFDGVSPLFVLTKYTSNVAPVQVASGVEARLIQAEAQGGPAMIASLNLLRADNANNGGFALGALVDPGTPASEVDLMFRERAFWMFATGHRLGDLRRLVRQYARAVNTVYPNGAYFKGAPPAYGTSTELPVPQSERNNPNFAGCDFTTP